HGHHVAARLVRRVEHRLQLPRARGTDARLEPGERGARGGIAVNRQLNRLAIVAIALLVALVVATTYWQAWASASLQDKQDNAIQRVVQFTIARGLITSNGKSAVFATNKKKKV